MNPDKASLCLQVYVRERRTWRRPTPSLAALGEAAGGGGCWWNLVSGLLGLGLGFILF
ncbi:hypothetical protein V6Z12_D05G377100 [Gossypium hirsutum]